jgi:hypothetical protein
MHSTVLHGWGTGSQKYTGIIVFEPVIMEFEQSTTVRRVTIALQGYSEQDWHQSIKGKCKVVPLVI